MNEEEQFLSQVSMDLQLAADKLREEKALLSAELAQRHQAYAEALDIIKEQNSVIDRLRIHIQQGVEL
jgi:hypothetical protein